MNRLFRSISVIVAISFAIITFIHYHQDLDLVIPFYSQITLMISLLLLILFVFRLVWRWKNYALLKDNDGFVFTRHGWSKLLTNELMPFFIFLPLIVMLNIYTKDAVVFSSVLLLIMLEGFVFLIIAKNHFKIMLNDKAIIYFSNQPDLIRWEQIKQIKMSEMGILVLKTNGKKLFIENESFVNAKEIRFQIKKSAIDRHILLEEIGLLV
ncbi:MAG: DUF986 family protein [Bacteroidota bacterium]|nr:DUF986 family protein [Bacteroidota bacterium]